jgi:hypothetical protein
MALTLEAEQRLARVSLIAFYDQHRDIWLRAARESHRFIRTNFPADAAIRPDDVAKALKPVLEVNERLRNKLNADKLSQKYWITDFTDLIVDRAWREVLGGGNR